MKVDDAISHLKKLLGEKGRVLRETELRALIAENEKELDIPASVSIKQFIDKLRENELLKKVVLTSDEYRSISRYVYREPSAHLLALSLKDGSYLSHGTAVALHGLNEQIPTVIYVNKEQSVKPSPRNPLTQEGLDRAFANKQRESRYIYLYQRQRIVLLSGKNTGKLGVADFQNDRGEKLPATSVARTLIDITVRPSYGGGVFQVLAAYRGAKDRVTSKDLRSVLAELDYRYPYHQSIGYYMARAGFPKAELDAMRELGLAYDFYLDYGIPPKQREYDRDWRLFFPKGL